MRVLVHAASGSGVGFGTGLGLAVGVGAAALAVVLLARTRNADLTTLAGRLQHRRTELELAAGRQPTGVEPNDASSDSWDITAPVFGTDDSAPAAPNRATRRGTLRHPRHRR
jgi:hypothetical protein